MHTHVASILTLSHTLLQPRFGASVGADAPAAAPGPAGASGHTDEAMPVHGYEPCRLAGRSSCLAHSASCAPQLGDLRSGADLHMLAVAVAEELEHGIVAFVRAAADRVLHKHGAVAEIDRAENRGKDAHVRFAAADDQRVAVAGAKPLMEVGSPPGRIDRLVDGFRRRDFFGLQAQGSRAKARNDAESSR